MSTPDLQRLLVALDERDLADPALEAAARVSQRCRATIELVHVVPAKLAHTGNPTIPGGEEVVSKVLDLARRSRIEALTERFPGVGLDPAHIEDWLTVRLGRPGSELVAHARDTGADALFLGGHRSRGLIDFGGTARAVLAHSPCPVWVQPAPGAEIRRILVPVEADPGSHHTLEWARLLAKRFEAEVTVSHVFATPDFCYAPGMGPESGIPTYVVDDLRASERKSFDALTESFEWDGVSAKSRFVEASPVPEILEQAKECDLMVLGMHGRSRLSRQVLGSTAYAVLRDAPCGVLAVPHEEAEK